jgi:hypothetical protein
MSLKAFHIAFIALATLLALWLAVWAAGNGFPLLAGGAGAAAAALVVYGIWFLRKMKGVSLLVLAALATLAGVIGATAWAPAAAACPVCYGGAEAPVFDGARWSVVFLGGLTYLLMGGAAAVVIVLRRRVRAELAQGPVAKRLPFAASAASNTVEES